jgi:glyoxylase I family protein
MIRYPRKGSNMIKSIAHVCIMALDLDKTRRFYGDILELPCRFNFVKDGSVTGYYFQVNESNYIEVFRTADAVIQQSAVAHVCFEVDDIQSLYMRLKETGMEIQAPRLGADHTWQLWCKDPNGIDIEFQEYTDRSLQKTGGDCIVDW